MSEIREGGGRHPGTLRSAYLTLAVLALVFVASTASAQVCPGQTKQLVPYAKETLTVSNTSKALTSSVYASAGHAPQMASLTLTGDAIRYWDDTTAPSSSVGHLIPLNGLAVPFVVCGQKAIENFRAIRVTGDATLTVTYLQ